MRVTEIRTAGARPFPSSGTADAPQPVTPGRALVAIAPAARARSGEAANHHHSAAFLAQLIAGKDQHPQTRERRRAEPHEAIAAYRAAAVLQTQ